MNAKEKAIEIYNKLRNENSIMTANVRAKKQALICVDEIINSHDWNVLKDGLDYWFEVKQEIEKL